MEEGVVVYNRRRDDTRGESETMRRREVVEVLAPVSCCRPYSPMHVTPRVSVVEVRIVGTYC